MLYENLGNLIWASTFKIDFFPINLSEASSLKANRAGELHGQKRAERLDPISSLGKSRSVSLSATAER